MGSSTENSAYGPSHNPWDPSRVPGGSGGGSAAAVSAGRAVGARLRHRRLDQAAVGPLRQRRPSPDYGTVSRYGIVAFASSLDQVGPVARTSATAPSSTRSSRDVTSATPRRSSCPQQVELPDTHELKGLRIGVPKELNEAEGIEPGVAEAVRAAIAKLEELGAEVGECSLPLSVDFGLACYYLITPAEASSNLARYDGVRYGYRADADERLEMYERTRDEGFGDEPKRRIMVGTYALSAGYYDAYYAQAQKVRTVIKREHDALFETFDALVSPTSPTVAFPLGARTADRSRCTSATCSRSRPAWPACPVSASRAASRRGCPWASS
jgi:Asp-tRNAAsn/Glu-tRNAGln amidotransferase A subunit and related amidases